MKKVIYRQMSIYVLVFIAFNLVGLNALSDLRPPQLTLNLSCENHTYSNKDVVQFTLTFKNQTNKCAPVLLPGYKNKGLKLIYFSYYTVKDNHYTEVYRDSRSIVMDSLNYSSVDFRYLNAYDSISIPIFLNDTNNFRKHIEANYGFPDLEPGNYEVRAWYNPWSDTMSKYAFNKIPLYHFSTQPLQDNPSKLTVPEEGLISNLISITITDSAIQDLVFEPTTFCPIDCKFCEAVEEEQWEKVAKIIKDQTYYNGKAQAKKVDSTWLQPHRNVAWVYHGPDAILASLPTYTSRRVVFKNDNGFHYYTARWQIGIVYPTRSRLKSWTYWIGNSGAPIKTSEVDYMKLISFDPY